MIRSHKPFLGVIVLFALCTNAMAAVLCPHLNGKICCVSREDDPGTSPQNISFHEQMETMDMPMEGDGQTGDIVTAATNFAEVVTTTQAINDHSGDKTTCPHCLMHSQSTLISTSASEVATSAHDTVALAPNGLMVETRFSLLSPQDLRDHGPPGPTNPRYVVNNTFRI